jgi:hypothetical protein
MRKERGITVKVIENKKISIDRLAKFFADKYNENKAKQKS